MSKKDDCRDQVKEELVTAYGYKPLRANFLVSSEWFDNAYKVESKATGPAGDYLPKRVVQRMMRDIDTAQLKSLDEEAS